MNIQQIRYFNSVAVLENISKAADLLDVGQSTLSKSIAKLEEEVGCPLFIRNGKNIKLNASGKVFFSYSVKLLETYMAGIKEAQKLEQEEEKRVRVCIIGSYIGTIKCIAAFNKEYPDIEFSVDGVLDDDEEPDLNSYDALIYPESPKYEKYEGMDILKDRMCLCVNGNHPLSSKLAVSIKDLNGIDAVFLRKDKNVETVFWGLEALSVKVNKVYFANNREMQMHMISEGIAAGFVLESSKEVYEHKNELKFLKILDNRFGVSLKMVFRPYEELSYGARLFKSFAEKFYSNVNKKDMFV